MVDYAYYTANYGGFLIPEDKFSYYEQKAAAYVNTVTFGRAESNITADVKNAVCDAAECLFRASQNKAVSSGISSEKVGEYQVSYVNGNEISSQSMSQSLYSSVKFWLGNSGLMYRGNDDAD